jgi:serine phosphatase RsbU (regulator of sigma subunit)/PAS domain-containing protein
MNGRKMPQGKGARESLADLAARRDALRHAAGVPGADPRALLDAAITELDAAIDALASSAEAGGAGETSPDGGPEAIRTERRLLHAAFQQAPVPSFLLEQDGTIRRANNQAAALLGSPSGYTTGKALTVFVDLAAKAALQTQLAAAVRTGKPRQASCRMLTAGGPADVTLAVAPIDLPGDPPLLMVTATLRGRFPLAGAGQEAGGQPAAADRAAGVIRSMTRRMDMVTAVTRLLLDNSTFSEAVTLQRCARLLAGEIADWVIVDVERGGRLRRQFAAGPKDRQAEQLARTVRNTDPGPDSLPWQVHATGKSLLLAHVDDAKVLGTAPDGTPLLMMLGATSLICVPVSDGAEGYGTLTLARRPGAPHFAVADLALAEELGGHLAISMRVDRMFRHRSEVAEALQASLLPARLPAVPGLDLAAAYAGATRWQEISGDFYDVFRFSGGWAVAIGDVCGKGQDAAAMTAAARHALRAFAHVHPAPAQVLAAANEVLCEGDYDERFVSVKLAFFEPGPGSAERLVRVRLGSSGHPGPAVVRADGRVEILEGDGLPLGLFRDSQPNAEELELREGDLLFFYTDGVTDARNADLEFFEEHLPDALAALAGRSAAETVRAIQERVTAFCDGELRDDLTILAVKVGPAA